MEGKNISIFIKITKINERNITPNKIEIYIINLNESINE
jgi:hypothetical protein